MKARYLLLLLAVALWTVILVANCSEPPGERRATRVTLAASELAQIERQARVLCARTPTPAYIALPDGVLVCTDEPRRPRSQITALFPTTTEPTP